MVLESSVKVVVSHVQETNVCKRLFTNNILLRYSTAVALKMGQIY